MYKRRVSEELKEKEKKIEKNRSLKLPRRVGAGGMSNEQELN